MQYALPFGVKTEVDERSNGSISVNLVFRIAVKRDSLLDDLLQTLCDTITQDIDTLKLPLQ